jgi:hypothetical protein
MNLRDYVTRKEIGIRIEGAESCRVIRFQNGSWIEIGQKYSLPVESSVLEWNANGIPASTLAVALRIYELDHPEEELRSKLSRKVRKRPRTLSSNRSDRSVVGVKFQTASGQE